jgi:hypothetical protein
MRLSANTSVALFLLSLSCRKDLSGESASQRAAQFAGPPGGKAGNANEAGLQKLRSMGTDKAPASIRPDPDRFVRNLLREYRKEGTLVARQIGQVEQYRLLLGGATEDFQKPAQETYDATSVLAMQKVSESICAALVSPTPWEHPGWKTILPAPAKDRTTNLKFLAQRILGKPSQFIKESLISTLTEMADAAANNETARFENYILPCVALSMDAEALLL